ncbi:hypothetical protein [Francisella sp. SYW-9]|uniref:hypothetical protein n=1 Tax=Francisella sp. SYW-9 TaxID=2610888 RepID=UPI00123DFD86|nr:hypothetical protein [Francisella sp. SYW-9]
MKQLSQLDILSFAIDLQAYLTLRSSEGNKKTIFGKYNKTDKLDASKKLLALLEGKDISFTDNEISIIRNGRLGNLCRKFAKKHGFTTLREFLKSIEFKDYTSKNISHDLKVDTNKCTEFLSNEIKNNNYTIKDDLWKNAKTVQADQTFLTKINGLIDLCYKFCKDQVDDEIFTKTPFHKWTLMDRYNNPPVMEFYVLGNFYYVSDRVPSNGELRSDNFLNIMKKNPNLNITSLIEEYPFDLIFMISECQQIVTKLKEMEMETKNSDKNKNLRALIFKKYYGY